MDKLFRDSVCALCLEEECHNNVCLNVKTKELQVRLSDKQPYLSLTQHLEYELRGKGFDSPDSQARNQLEQVTDFFILLMRVLPPETQLKFVKELAYKLEIKNEN